MLLLPFAEAFGEELHLVQVPVRNKAEYVRLLRSNMDVAAVVPGERVDIVASQEDIHDLIEAGYQVIVQIQDLSSFYATRASADFGGFKTYSQITTYLGMLHADHPSITTAPFSIGETAEGRELWAMKISDNPSLDEDEPEVLFTGVTHAREPIGGEVILYTMDYLTDNYGSDETVTEIIDGRELYFVPVVNPDGYVYNELTDPEGGGLWRKNRRDNGGGAYGVDINRNYGYEWGHDDMGSSPDSSSIVYRGQAPFSEPETQAIRDLAEAHAFAIVVDYHSAGNVLLYPWGYDRLYTPDDRFFVSIADSASSLNGYTRGPGWTLYLANGVSQDWEYGEQTTKPMAFGFVSEVGSGTDGFWPEPSRITPLCQENLPVNLLMAEIADNPRRLAVPLPPTALVSSPAYAGGYRVSWTLDDLYSPADVYTLVEMTGKTTSYDDAESGSDLWKLDGFSLSGARAHSDAGSYYSGTGDNLRATMLAADRLDVGPADTLSLWCWYEIETDWDYAYVQISTDGGLTFENLAGNITTNDNPNQSNKGEGITGNSGGWVKGLFPMDSYSGRQLTVRILYATDGAWFYEGFYCDDIGPLDTFAESTILSGSITDTWFDVDGREPGLYYYKVRARDAEGQFGLWSDRAVADVVPDPIVDYLLWQNTPNPFSRATGTTIRYQASEAGKVKMRILDAKGRLVRTVEQEATLGENSLRWDGVDQHGHPVASGVYIYEIDAAAFHASKKMTLVE
jgi:murein tripeptide amidase MpaA